MSTKLDAARVQLLLAHPFFACIAMKHPMRVVNESWCKTACVDAKGCITFNEKFLDTLTIAEVQFLIAHEAMHVVYAHLARMGNRDPKLWNIAADASINDLLTSECVGQMPKGGVWLEGASKKTTEQLYSDLLQNASANQQKSSMGNPDGNGNQDGNGNGDNGDDGEDGQGAPSLTIQDLNPELAKGLSQEDADAQQIQGKLDIAQAMQSARMAGRLSSNLSSKLGEILESKVPWYELLEKHMTAKSEIRHSWTRPNKRFAGRYYLPRRDRLPGMGEIIVSIDVSCSISSKEVSEFIGHLNRIIDQCRPERVHVLYVTTEVEHVETFERSEYPIRFEQTNRWWGGTDMMEGFRWQEIHAPEADMIITFTDGYTPYGNADIDAVWCITKDGTSEDAPFGETIHLE